MMRQTGGTAVAATSTRSRLRCVAISSARAIGTTSCVPSTSISRTSLARICWLMRTLGVGIGLEIGHLLVLGRRFLGFGEYARNEIRERHRGELLATAPRARCDGSLRGLAIAEHQHVGRLLELGLADLVT